MGTTKVYAYLRKSTEDQNTKGQELAVLQYANANWLRIDQWFDVDCSSRKSTKERWIDELLGLIGEGGTLIVPELSRLGENLGPGRIWGCLWH
jgi:DNA invertase Pin-like site-specific DNA recombinase